MPEQIVRKPAYPLVGPIPQRQRFELGRPIAGGLPCRIETPRRQTGEGARAGGAPPVRTHTR